jgi:hypothetical protein
MYICDTCYQLPIEADHTRTVTEATFIIEAKTEFDQNKLLATECATHVGDRLGALANRVKIDTAETLVIRRLPVKGR